ncbi:CBO0543 family protein [Bacillus sp. JJ1566]|uniref:CBO0543 family protein n=1 Tax=Bacillus sp. JJ1566 TaxID=3122961 RepID=UPI003000D453
MNFDFYVLILLWIVLPVVLWKGVPKSRLREAIAAFLFFQMLTWVFSIALTYAGLLESPVRFFKHATKVSFTMEFLVFPSIAVFFQMSFPRNAPYKRRLTHYLLWVGIILLTMFTLSLFTNIMSVNPESMIRSFFNFLIELWLCRRYVLWVIEQPISGKVGYP